MARMVALRISIDMNCSWIARSFGKDMGVAGVPARDHLLSDAEAQRFDLVLLALDAQLLPVRELEEDGYHRADEFLGDEAANELVSQPRIAGPG